MMRRTGWGGRPGERAPQERGCMDLRVPIMEPINQNWSFICICMGFHLAIEFRLVFLPHLISRLMAIGPELMAKCRVYASLVRDIRLF